MNSDLGDRYKEKSFIASVKSGLKNSEDKSTSNTDISDKKGDSYKNINNAG